VLQRLRRRGVLLVADEVQCGFGRSGDHLWSFEASGIVPDFVTLGKPMGNGHPVAAVVTRAEIAERFAEKGDLFSTFGGNPVACRAALAVLDIIEQEDIRANAREVGSFLKGELTALGARHPCIGDIRAAGLLIGVDLVTDSETREPAPDLADEAANGMRQRRVLVGTTGRAGNVLKIRPPLVLTPDEARLVATTLDATLGNMSGRAKTF
jgi:4-aminobutyrate aminotransferase-like enzyme